MEKKELKERLDVFRHAEHPRLRRLGAYYAGRHAILEESKDPGKPDNRLVCNFCRSITDSTVGYFMGIPVSYDATDEETLAEALRVSGRSDEPFLNSAIARDLSVYGSASEIIWCADDGGIRVSALSPENTFPVFSDDVDRSLIAAVRFYMKSDGKLSVHCIDDDAVYEFEETSGGLAPVSETEHYFGAVPLNFYSNNRDGTGDFEPVLTLVDAYNRLQSESVNDFELFADSYLAISGMGGTNAEDLEAIRRNRVLLLDDGGDAKWLTKSVNDSYIENLKTRIARDIYRFSGTVDISELTGSGDVISGVAMKYRLINFENRVSVTEQHFRRGLMRRWRLIGNLYGTWGRHFDWMSLKANFTRNLPGNYEAAAELASKLDGIISKKTLLGLLPFVENIADECERITDEKGADA